VELIANGVLLPHLIGATFLRVLLGYERFYHGRAAGMHLRACLRGLGPADGAGNPFLMAAAIGIIIGTFTHLRRRATLDRSVYFLSA